MAGFISQETIDLVLNNTDIVSLIGEYTKLEPRGSDYWGCCPFHSEKTASFHVEPDKRFYYCFGCRAAGNSIKFIMEQEKLSYAESIEFLAKKAGIPIKYEESYEKPVEDKKTKLIDEYISLYERTASMFHYMLTETSQGAAALEYITKRGISMETIKKFKLGYSPADRRWLKKFLLKKNFSERFLDESGLFSRKYPEIAFFSNRLMFPIFNRRGQVVAFGGRKLTSNPDSPKYINSGDLIQYKKGETLYAFHFAKKAIKEAKRVVLCEGYMDCIAYHQCGITYAVAPLGTALTDEQIKMVRPFVNEVLLSFDSDEAGQNATIRAILMLRQNNVTARIIRLKGAKDPAEVMINFGPETLTNFVNGAILDSDFLLSRLGTLYPVDTPEGKTKASLEFFTYIDSLQSYTQKESSLEQLCQAFNLKPEAVRRDFQNREKAHERLKYRQPASDVAPKRIEATAELRSVLAIIADLDKYETIRSEIFPDDFDDFYAKTLLSIIEECYKKNSLNLPEILGHCEDENLANYIASSIASNEYSRDVAESAIHDSLRMIQRKRLSRQRDKIIERIRDFDRVTEDDNEQYKALLKQKLDLDSQLAKK
ncbi:MAG: DNA primase [Treponema sp.]|nr:DNA primase [Treponema sp.]